MLFTQLVSILTSCFLFEVVSVANQLKYLSGQLVSRTNQLKQSRKTTQNCSLISIQNCEKNRVIQLWERPFLSRCKIVNN